MNLDIVMQWSESVDQEVVSLTRRSSRSSSCCRRPCRLHFRLQQVGWAKWPSAGVYALKTAHLTRLRQALGSQVFQMGVACWLIKSTSASHLLISSPAWTSVQRTAVKRWLSMVSATATRREADCWGGATITGALLCARGNSSLAYDVSNNNLLFSFICSRACLSLSVNSFMLCFN